MNKQFLLLAVLAMPVAAFAVDRGLGDVNDDFTSKTTLADTPFYSVGSPLHISLYRNDRLVARKDGCWGCWQVVGFGGHSSSSDEIARYFSKQHKTCLVVGEAPIITDASGGGIINGGSDAFKRNVQDVLANNFGIHTANHDFQSYICFKPEQKFQGGAFNYRVALSDREDMGWWADITIPIVHVRNSMNMCERIVNQGTLLPGSMSSMTQAFLNPAWNYGKICPTGLDKTRIADIEIRVGRDGVRKEHCRHGGYVGLLVPTGNARTGEYLFEPVVGSGHHFGILWGSAMAFKIWEDEDLSLMTCLDMNNRFLFEHQEMRSFDLYDKQWSRYLNIFTEQSATTSTPGINAFTRCMSIVPRASYQINTALLLSYRKFRLEGGFNFYARQAERGWLTKPWTTGPAIAGYAAGQSMSNATMKMWDNGLIGYDTNQGNLHQNNTLNDVNYHPITAQDLDLTSALNPAVINQTIYATLGYDDTERDYPTFAGLGSSLQWSHNNAGINRWSVWGKVGMSV